MNELPNTLHYNVNNMRQHTSDLICPLEPVLITATEIPQAGQGPPTVGTLAPSFSFHSGPIIGPYSLLMRSNILNVKKRPIRRQSYQRRQRKNRTEKFPLSSSSTQHNIDNDRHKNNNDYPNNNNYNKHPQSSPIHHPNQDDKMSLQDNDDNDDQASDDHAANKKDDDKKDDDKGDDPNPNENNHHNSTTKRQSATKRRAPKKRIIPLQCSTRNRSKKPKRSTWTAKETQCLGNDLATMCRTNCIFCKKIFQHCPTYVVAKKSKMIHGWGLFAKQPIPPNTFLMKYIGKEVSSVPKGKWYVIQIRNKFVDAEGQRGHHKYVNHCCDGGGENYHRSARLHLWSDQNGIEHVSIVTNRQVEKGEELLVNYGGNYVIGDCRCPNCRNDDRQTRGTQTQQPRNESET